MADSVMDASGELLNYCHLTKKREYCPIWMTALTKEVRQLAQGIPGLVEGTDTIKFITKEEIPLE